MAQKQEEDDKVRLDKWLWAARFYKTRALAKTAIESGKVHCRGERCKPSKEPRLGDELQIRVGLEERTVEVKGLSVVRRGAPEAQLLYAETEQSIAKAVRFLAREEKLIAEAGSATTVAAIAEHGSEIGGRNVALVLSGGNIDGDLLARLVCDA